MDAHGIMIIFNVTDRGSFEYSIKHLKEIKQHINNENIPKLLVANKIDLKDKRVVLTDEAKLFAKQNNMQYIETSAKTGENVNEAFELMIYEIYKKKDNSLLS